MSPAERNISPSDEDFALMAKRYEDAGDVQNAEIIRRQWEVARCGTASDEILALHRQLAGEKLRANQGWARAEAKSHECIELRERMAAATTTAKNAAVGFDVQKVHMSCDAVEGYQSNMQKVHIAGAPGLVTVRLDELMALARRLIAERLDDVDEEFMAGRAHGIGSLHSEILMLAKRGALAQGDAGNPVSVQVPVHAYLWLMGLGDSAFIEDRGGAFWWREAFNERADLDMMAIYERSKRSDGAREAHPQWGGQTPLPADQLAVDATVAAGSASGLSAADVDQNILSVALWLYRRLPRCYGRPSHVEGPIKALARRVGTDVADCLAERGPDPADGGTR